MCRTPQLVMVASVTMTAEVIDSVGERRLGGRNLLAFIGMALGMFLAVLNIQIVGSSFDEIRAGLAAGPDEVSWVLTASLIAEVIMIPMSGWLSRLFSTRYLFTLCGAGFTLASIACASATSIESMIVFRASQGFFGGAMAPMVFSTVYAAFPRRYQDNLIAIVSVLGTGAVALGPSLGGWISESLSWQWLFLFNVPFGILATVTVFVLVDFDRPDWELGRQIDIPGIALLAVFFMCLLIVLEEGRRADWFESEMIVTLTIITAISGLVLVWRELTCRYPVVDLRIFKNRNFAIGAFYIMIFGAGLFVPLYLLPLFLARIIGLNTFQIGSWLFVLGVSMMFAGFLVPTLLRYFRRRTVALVGFSLLAVGTWAQGRLTADVDFVYLLLPQLLRGFATQMCFLSMIGLALGLLPIDKVKDGTALFQLTMRLGAAVAVAIANSFLVTRAQIHYHEYREQLPVGQQYAGDIYGVLNSLIGNGIGESPALATAQVQILTRLVEREAVIQAFNEITVVVAALVALSLVLMPLVQSVRNTTKS